MTEHTFKTRYNDQKLSFNHPKHIHDTVLSKYIWDQKDNGTSYTIKWSIIKRANPYHVHPLRCNLCLSEKLCILSADKSTLLNKRSELITKCRHEIKFYAANQKQDSSNRPPLIITLQTPTVQSDDRLVRETRVTVTFSILN